MDRMTEISSHVLHLHDCLKRMYEEVNMRRYSSAEERADDAFYHLGVCKQLLREKNDQLRGK